MSAPAEAYEPTNPFSEGHVERTLPPPPPVPKESKESRVEKHSQSPSLMKHYENGPKNTVETRFQLPSDHLNKPNEQQTNSHSKGRDERHLQLPPTPHPRGDIRNDRISQNPVVSQQEKKIIPISKLDTRNHECRILIQPLDKSTFQADRARFRCLLPQGATYRQGPIADCWLITEIRDRAAFEISKPVRCKFYYDSHEDSISVLNRGVENLVIRDDPSSAGMSQNTTIGRDQHGQVGPGSWGIFPATGLGPPVIQFKVFPRTYRLSIADALKPPVISEARKRRLQMGQRPNTRRPNIMSPLPTTVSLCDVKAGQIASITTKDIEDYFMSLKKNNHNSLMSSVCLAKVSLYPDPIVVVKSIKGDSAISRGRAWKQEYSLHSKLQCAENAIVPIIGADARFSIIYLQWVDARDLGNREWRNGGVSGDHYFKGNDQDAVRVLHDMVRALIHLKERNVVHNDIKPANILYSRKAGAVLIDFGLATYGSCKSSSGGTPWYVGPDHLRGEGERGAPADVWALGIVMLYLLRLMHLPECYQGLRPWIIRNARDPSSKDHSDMVQWLKVIYDTAKNGLDEHNPLHNIVQKMLATRAQSRITPEEIKETLEQNYPGIVGTKESSQAVANSGTRDEGAC